MKEMIERVARAIDPDYWEQVDCPMAQVGNPNIYEWDGVKDSLARARAVIEAMRDPTPAIADAGSEFIYEAWGDGKTIAAEAWQAMIDAALTAAPPAR